MRKSPHNNNNRFCQCKFLETTFEFGPLKPLKSTQRIFKRVGVVSFSHALDDESAMLAAKWTQLGII
jgi:hypothetical protein